MAGGTLLMRWGHPEDVVEALLCLLRGDYVTGSAVFVDGGQRWVRGA